MTLRSSFWICAALSLVGCGPKPPPEPVDVRIATWNLHDFGAVSSDATRVAELATEMAPAILAVQEVAGEEAFNDLLARLPGYEGHLAAAGPASGGLRMGFVWDASKVQPHSTPTEPLPADSALFPRPPLQGHFAVLFPESNWTADFVLVNVHLKAGAQADDEDRRVRALAALEDHITTVAAGVDGEVLLLGDYNEAATDPRFSEAFAPFTNAPDEYRALTMEQALAGAFTFLPVPLFFDHMVATEELDEERGASAPVIQRYDETVTDYREAVSDHLPLTLDLVVPPATELEP